jgi:hypothetical protein
MQLVTTAFLGPGGCPPPTAARGARRRARVRRSVRPSRRAASPGRDRSTRRWASPCCERVQALLPVCGREGNETAYGSYPRRRICPHRHASGPFDGPTASPSRSTGLNRACGRESGRRFRHQECGGRSGQRLDAGAAAAVRGASIAGRSSLDRPRSRPPATGPDRRSARAGNTACRMRKSRSNMEYCVRAGSATNSRSPRRP